jgi:Spy/CpxP family protein refolding chaperone
MKAITALFTAATLLSSAAAFSAEPTTNDVGRFVYDQQGEIVGGLTAIGQGSATVSDGLMFHPG